MSQPQTPVVAVTTTLLPLPRRRRERASRRRFEVKFAPVITSSALSRLATSPWLRTLYHGLWGLVLPALVLWLWFEAATHEWLPAFILPEPAMVRDTFVDLWVSGELWSNLEISLIRVGWGFVGGTLAGLALGIAMGLSKRVEAYLYPSFKAISQIPALGWIPLLIMLVGIGEAMKILVIAKAALVPVTINTQQSIRNIPRSLLEVAQVYQFTPRQLLSKVVIPATVPGVFNGVRYGLTHAWLALVTVEMLASSEGTGFLMVWGRQLGQLDLVLATIVVIGAVGLLFDVTLQQIENRLARWRRFAF
jgi:sulfonate transport system permease protein